MVMRTMWQRRDFLKWISAAGLAAALPAVQSCSPSDGKPQAIKTTFRGANYTRGHTLRQRQDGGSAVEQRDADVVIVGAGISGLVTAYFLHKHGVENIALLELGDECGGNSSYGTTAYSAYPHGAHYLTLPNTGNTPLISFLHEKGIIAGFDDQGNIVYNDEDLCFDPEERLLIKGTFQEGLVPSLGLPDTEKNEIGTFFQRIEQYRHARGNDGKFFFDIPYSAASRDATHDVLDSISFRTFLVQQGYSSEHLLWYLDYCCRDDFGSGIDTVSAWAGVNYFASHRPHASTTDSSRVLTWPEGNGRLVKLLLDDVQQYCRMQCLVHNIAVEGGNVVVSGIDGKEQKAFQIRCKQCVVAVPPFIAARILDASLPYPRHHVHRITHAPWLVASVVLSAQPAGRGVPLCWDNVGYGTKALGYIYNQHQSLRQYHEKTCISLYMPLDAQSADVERKAALQRTEDEWQTIVLAELETMHYGITEWVEEIDVWVWGHGMAMPSVGLIKSGVLQELAQPIDNKVFFAHTDLSGYSVFEEGFDWGYRTAQQLIGLRT